MINFDFSDHEISIGTMFEQSGNGNNGYSMWPLRNKLLTHETLYPLKL
jgi:hypothetical protein